MGSHPINLLIRFLLEIAALFSIGMWGWEQSEGWIRYVLALGIPAIFAVVWGIFAVPGDPSRSDKAPIVTAGPVRLAIELGFFGLATWSLHDLGLTEASLAFGIIVVLHYAVSYDRIKWLVSR
ncbi:MAG: YrdB family protein [Bacteroidales bacterium]|nr:YrdB family protein [Bacteroidales bacterium]MCF8388344.1 YrdB family protein [Bacteroidales bacterium]MCF8399084.1 YrdB family protein [Bacteroidales bacterium]